MIWRVSDWRVSVELCCKGESKRLLVTMSSRVKDVKPFGLPSASKEAKCSKPVYIIHKPPDMKDFDITTDGIR